jgi:hypothetical protein
VIVRSGSSATRRSQSGQSNPEIGMPEWYERVATD